MQIAVGLEMHGIPVSEKYRGIKSDGIVYRRLVKYLSIASVEVLTVSVLSHRAQFI